MINTNAKVELYNWLARAFVAGAVFGVLAHFVLAYMRVLDAIVFTF